MKCSNCNSEINSKDRFCSNCGSVAVPNSEETENYLNEMQKFSKDQEEAKKLVTLDDLDLNNPTDILKAQLRMLISIFRRLEKLENREKEGLKVTVIDFDMPFSSMIIFEFKVILLGFFFMSIFMCLGFLIFGSFLGFSISNLLNNIR